MKIKEHMLERKIDMIDNAYNERDIEIKRLIGVSLQIAIHAATLIILTILYILPHGSKITTNFSFITLICVNTIALGLLLYLIIEDNDVLPAWVNCLQWFQVGFCLALLVMQ